MCCRHIGLGTHLKHLSHFGLLLKWTVVLQAQDDRKLAGDKRAFLDDVYNRSEADFWSERMAMIDKRETIIAVPAIEFDASAAC